MRIALASDHAGFNLRRAVHDHVREAGHEPLDLGCETPDSVDYPTFAALCAGALVEKRAVLGILVCGTGIGMSLAANRVPGARAALCTDEFMARMARAHNDANILCLGERVVGAGSALSIVDVFLATAFVGGRHARRVGQLTALETQCR